MAVSVPMVTASAVHMRSVLWTHSRRWQAPMWPSATGRPPRASRLTKVEQAGAAGEPNLRVGASVRCVGDGERAGEVGPHYALTALRAYRLTTPIICVTVLMQSYRRSDEAVRLRS